LFVEFFVKKMKDSSKLETQYRRVFRVLSNKNTALSK
jgi:hypothetical protein